MTDITEIPVRDGKLYVSAVFDCYDLGVLGLAMADNRKSDLCVSTSMNSDGGRCHDNARCEAMWARRKEELLVWQI